MALSARAAPPGLPARLRPRAGDLGIALTLAVALYAGSRTVLWAGCGGVTEALCAPLASMFARFETRTLPAAVVLALLVAPAEELFWRGVVQERLAARLGRWRGVAATTAIATAVSLATGEPLLALATAPTYAAWGALAAWRGSLVGPIVSHAAWTLLVAVLAPPRLTPLSARPRGSRFGPSACTSSSPSACSAPRSPATGGPPRGRAAPPRRTARAARRPMRVPERRAVLRQEVVLEPLHELAHDPPVGVRDELQPERRDARRRQRRTDRGERAAAQRRDALEDLAHGEHLGPGEVDAGALRRAAPRAPPRARRPRRRSRPGRCASCAQAGSTIAGSRSARSRTTRHDALPGPDDHRGAQLERRHAPRAQRLADREPAREVPRRPAARRDAAEVDDPARRPRARPRARTPSRRAAPPPRSPRARSPSRGRGRAPPPRRRARAAGPRPARGRPRIHSTPRVRRRRRARGSSRARRARAASSAGTSGAPDEAGGAGDEHRARST